MARFSKPDPNGKSLAVSLAVHLWESRLRVSVLTEGLLGDDDATAVSNRRADARHRGRYSAPAANEPGYTVEAEIYQVQKRHNLATRSEIEEAVWVDHVAAMALPLASLTRSNILPIARVLIHFPDQSSNFENGA